MHSPNIILITHNDLDAAGCACVLHGFNRRSTIRVKYCNYANLHKQLREAQVHNLNNIIHEVYVTDITPDAEDIQYLLDGPGGPDNVRLYDHHETRRDISEKYGKYSSEYCATRMLFADAPIINQNKDLLFLEEFVNAVDAFDCWKLDSEYRALGETLDRLCKFFGIEKFVELMCNNHFNIRNIALTLGNLDEMLVGKNKQYTAQKLETSKLMFDPFRQVYCCVSTVEQCHNEVAHGMLKMHQDASYAVIIHNMSNTIGLRSRRNGKTQDVSRVATEYGGGGHKNAGGISTEDGVAKFLSCLQPATQPKEKT